MRYDHAGNGGDMPSARRCVGQLERSGAVNIRVDTSSIACPDCDLLQQLPPLPRGAKARCLRCGSVLASRPGGPRDLPLALALAAVITFGIANVAPLMDLSVIGRTASTTIVGGAYQMWLEGEPLVSALIAFCAVLAPGAYLVFMLILLIAARRTPPPQWVGEMLRWAHHFEMWSMLEVMMLGILVALIKIAELAAVEAGIGMYAVFALIVLMPSILVTFDARELWSRIDLAGDGALRPASAGTAVAEAQR
jgi:paraquat-inducible protein A